MDSYSVEAVMRASGVHKFVSDFQDATRSVQNFTQKNEKTFASFRQVGTMATAAGTAVAAGLGFAVSKAAEFESAMSEVKAISGSSGKEMEQLESIAREMGASTSFSASEAAEGLKYMALAGWDTQQMMGGIEPVLHLAEAGALDLGRASDLVTDSMAAMGIEVQDLDGYLDKVAATSSNANTDIDALMEAFVIAGGTFDRFNVPLEESSAMLGVLANRGFKGSEAGTALNAIMARLTSGTGEAATALDEMGISAFDSEGNFRGMETVMYDVKEALDGMDDEQRSHYQTMLAGLNHGKTFSAMLDGLGSEYQDLKGDIKDSDGALKDMRDTMKDNLQGALENLSSAFEEIMISIGSALLPAVKQLADWLQNLADWFNNLSEGTKSFIAISAAVVAALMLIVGPIMLLVGFIPMIVSGFAAIGTVIAALMSPITLVVGAIIAAAALIIIYWEPIKEFFINLWESIKEITIAVWDSLVEVWNTSVEWLKEIWIGVSGWFAELWESIKQIFVMVWESIAEEWNAFVEMMQIIFEPIIEFFSTVWESVSEVFTNAWEVISDTLSTVWESIQTAASAAWELIKNAILGPILLLINLVTGDMEAFKTNLSSIWENIKNAASKIWESLKTAVMAIVKGLINYIKTGWDGLKSVTSTVFSALSNLASRIWEGLKNAISGIVDGISSTVSSVWEGIKSTVTDLAEGAKQGAIDAWETLKDKTSEAFNKVVDFIKDPLGDIDLFSMGEDIIQGLINGIGSMARAVWDEAKSIANGIGDSIKGALGIASPSKLMKEFGVFTGQGLEIGMQSMIRDINKASEDMAAAATPNLQPLDISGRVSKINRHSNSNPIPIMDNEKTPIKNPAYINVSIGGREYKAFVDDITETQDRKTRMTRAFI